MCKALGVSQGRVLGSHNNKSFLPLKFFCLLPSFQEVEDCDDFHTMFSNMLFPSSSIEHQSPQQKAPQILIYICVYTALRILANDHSHHILTQETKHTFTMYVHAVEITRSLQQKGTPVTKNIPERINHHQTCMKVCTKTIPEPILKKTPLLSGYVQTLKQSRGRTNSELFQLTSRFNHEYITRAYSYMYFPSPQHYYMYVSSHVCNNIICLIVSTSTQYNACFLTEETVCKTTRSICQCRILQLLYLHAHVHVHNI